MMARRLIFTVLLSVAALSGAAVQSDDNPAAPGFNLEGSDAQAVQLADAVMESMGGRQAWDETRHVVWKFFGRRKHVWDKHTGNIRVEGVDREDGKPYVTLMNLHSKEGRAWRHGREVTDPEDLKQMLDDGEAAWINDSYWIVMPYKLKDSGVTLKYLGDADMEDGRPAEVLQLTFEDVGRTPENKYEVFVAQDSGLVEQWNFYADADDDEPRFKIPWHNWQPHGSILLSDDRGRGKHTDVAVHTELPESVFTSPEPTTLFALTETEKANNFFEQAFQEKLARSPMFQTMLGLKDNYGKWDDFSDAAAQEDLAITQRQLQELRDTLDLEQLDPQGQISYRLFVFDAEQEIDNFKYRFHGYPVNQMFGFQSGAPAFLINMHRVTSSADAEAYLSRLEKLDEAMDQVIEGLAHRAEREIIAPKFVFPYVLSDSSNVIQGQPFDDGDKDSTLMADFRGKVEALELSDDEKGALLERAEANLLQHVRPGYERLIQFLAKLEEKATTDDGAWKLPDGEAFYNRALRNRTTTELSAEEIHQIGLREVARVHDEMRGIIQQVGFDGSLQEFFEFMREDSRFYYEETEDGRQAYLDEATRIIDAMRNRLDDMFLTKPEAEILVKAVEPFREKSAGKAFYQRPAPDGSRPGTYYANLYKMSDMPTYQMEALAYHEGIPGHHMQLAIAGELASIPKFRKFGGYTAHTEGWGLYSEYLPKEFGFYEDPYSDFGRLAMELWRACRLVVDTGIHAERWTREQAIAYLKENTPNPEGDAIKAIERYIVMPGQATAYKIGMLKILELRENARTQLGERFDLREFHDLILQNGSVPLPILEELVEGWVARLYSTPQKQ